MEYILVILGALAAGFIKGGFALGSGILPVAILSLFLSPNRVVVLLYPAMLMTTVFSLIPNWGKWDLRIVKVMIPASFIGSWVGVYILMIIPGDLLRVVLGLFALFFVFREGRPKRGQIDHSSRNPSWRGSSIAGLFGGMSSSLTHAGGMVFSMYLIRLGLTKERFVATLVLVFFVNDSVKGLFYGQASLLNISDLKLLFITAAASLIGVLMGVWSQRLVTLSRFRYVIFSLLSLSGIALLGSTVSHWVR